MMIIIDEYTPGDGWRPDMDTMPDPSDDMFVIDPDSEWFKISPAVWELNDYASTLIREALVITSNITAIPKRLYNVAP
jgi:hypothetical protein